MDKIKTAMIRCTDNAENLVFVKYICQDGDVWYEMNVEDAYCCGHEFEGFIGRVKRAWSAFIARPVSYAGIVVENRNQMRQFLTQCLALIDEEEDV